MKFQEKISAYFARDWVVFLFLFAVTMLLYGNTLNAPFYFDDIPQIVKQAFTYDLTKASQLLFKPRGIVNFSFALNFHFFGMSMPAFHAVNILLHLATAFFVFLVLKRVFPNSRAACLFGAMIFLCHPLQTQTVNYIVQRMTGLCGFFLFLSLYLFVRAREVYHSAGLKSLEHIFLYCAFAISAGFAVLAKQNAATLPFLLFLFDSIFLNKSRKEGFLQRTLYLAPLVLAPAVLGFILVVKPMLTGETLSRLGNFENLIASKDAMTTYSVSPFRYFVTELSVFWIYFKLLFLPINQALDYGYPLVEKLLTVKNVVAGFGLVLLVVFSAIQNKRHPYLFFAVLWFFIALLVESTIIPLDPIYEHRLYIPMFGFSVLTASLFSRFIQLQPKYTLILSCMICLILSMLTISRNNIWAEPIKFYEAEVRNSYGGYRAMIGLADAYYESGEIAKAEKEYDQVIGLIESESIRNIQPKMLVNIAVAYGRFKDYPKAEKLLRLALTRSPTEPSIHYNLGIALFLQNKLHDALDAFKTSRKLKPGNPDSFYYVILLSSRLDTRADIPKMLKHMQTINPEYASRLKFELGY